MNSSIWVEYDLRWKSLVTSDTGLGPHINMFLKTASMIYFYCSTDNNRTDIFDEETVSFKCGWVIQFTHRSFVIIDLCICNLLNKILPMY